ncbi:hypothetical protein E2F50_06650 [Rhizobium deserti]|uniref:Capsule biosynthesis protein n=1 Tax=Rhizobium deserti TaxID=2547961 RepID=A0A4R5UIQ7_9HYPH|nr:hypothetical protein [Rhizobium deserti]TDK36603.1 hypothetical protein E2F50_06650 [Rhizobium deserti]
MTELHHKAPTIQTPLPLHGSSPVAVRTGRSGVDVTVEGRTQSPRITGAKLLFTLLVLLPTAAASAYFFFIASDIYVAEGRFIVRDSSGAVTNPLGNMLQALSVGSASTGGDAYAAVDYLESRNALDALDADGAFTSIVGKEEVDPLMRFPSLYRGETREDLFRYYSNLVTVKYDPSSGISTITARAFAPDSAQLVVSKLLLQAQEFVNSMSEQALSDALSYARDDVRLAEKRLTESQGLLTTFRTQTAVLDPEAVAKSYLATADGLRKQLIEAQTRLSSINQLNASSPEKKVLSTRIQSLEQSIADEQARVVGNGKSMVSFFEEYERLKLESELANQTLVSAKANFEKARMELMRKQVYLVPVVKPNLVDDALEPKRFLSVLTVFITLFLVYAMGWLLYVNAREHKD